MNVRSLASGVALLAVTFAAGALAGTTYARAHARRHDASMMAAHEVLLRLGGELGLDSSQHRQIGDILTKHQASVDSAWTSMQPRIHLALDSTLHDIMGVLRPDQVAKYRAFVERMHPGMLKH